MKQGYLLPNDQLLSMDLDLDGKLESLVLHRSGQVDLVQIKKNGEILNITKLIEDWGSLPNKGIYFQSFIAIDEMGTGQLALLGIDKDGNIKKAVQESEQWKLVETDVALQNRFGKNVRLNAIDFTQDGKIDLMLGTSGGGIMLFENLMNSAVFQLKDKRLQVWPNPSQGEIFVRSSENGYIQIVDLNGRILMKDIRLIKNESLHLVLADKLKGLLFVQFINENGHSEQTKIINP